MTDQPAGSHVVRDPLLTEGLRPGMTMQEQQRQRRAQDVIARIGDGSQLTAEDWPLLTYDERVQLMQVNPDRYRQLRDGLTGSAWRPSQQAGGLL